MMYTEDTRIVDYTGGVTLQTAGNDDHGDQRSTRF